MRSRAPALRLVPSACSKDAITGRWPSAGEAGLGCLDAAAAIGRDPFKSPVRLWMERTERHDLLQPVDPCLARSADTAAYWSRLLEPIVAAHYALRTGRQVQRTRAVLRHPQYPWMLAHPGRDVVGAPDVQLLECRCVGMDAAELWGAGLAEARSGLLAVERAMRGLPHRHQAIFMGLRIHELTRDEMAARHGLSLRRVGTTLRQALAHCAQSLR
ncbi:YqaJ viral recombinase family protein [Variovorax sp. RO1]|uniref:YqaJ viral recombinase family protein n=1 Tax=Variovorax sp. RO1 TaxID=2066034 RepID=UPI0015DED5DB|nr:YqaJ viral recombinase family protein [Variovorax sp. RO1]